MGRKQNRPRTDGTPTRRWPRVLAVVGGVLLALTVAVLVCLHFVFDALGPRHTHQDHDHPPGPHGGTMVAVGGENHYHAEAVFERAGWVRLYTYGEDETQIYPTDARPVPATVRRPADATEFSILLSPEPQPGDPPGTASRFGGRLPRELDGGRIELVVPGMTFGGGRHRVAVKSEGEWHNDPAAEQAATEEERKLYLTPSGKYTEADIRANGGGTASEKFKGVKAEHDDAPKPGDRICPVSRTKANPKFAWVVGGKEYLFCCPPCVDEFVRWAKQNPDAVRPPEEYLQRP